MPVFFLFVCLCLFLFCFLFLLVIAQDMFKLFHYLKILGFQISQFPVGIWINAHCTSSVIHMCRAVDMWGAWCTLPQLRWTSFSYFPFHTMKRLLHGPISTMFFMYWCFLLMVFLFKISPKHSWNVV